MKFPFRKLLLRRLTAAVFLFSGTLQGKEKPKETEPPPIKALLVTGGASHDYTRRKEILVRGIRERVSSRIEWVVRHEGDGESDVRIPLFQGSGWADGHDIVVHDYCFPRVKDRDYVERILAPHRAGLPAVLVHGTMHSFRTGDDAWFDFCGATSRSHGKTQDFTVEPAPGGNSVIAGMIPWTIPQGELYRIERLHSGSTALTFSRYPNGEGEKQPSTWSHLYGPAKTRVFGSTLGNETATVMTPAYLDMLARGFLWALDDLTEERFVRVQAEDSLASLALAVPKARLPHPGPSLVTGGRPAALSSATSPLLAVEGAIDGDPDTYWEAAAAGPSSWQVDLRKERSVGALMLSWRAQAPRRYQIESSADALSWRMLLDTSGEGEAPVTIGFDPLKLRYVRISISETAPGFVPGIREFAAYGRMDDLPSAFPDFLSINGVPRTNLPTLASAGWERTIRLAPDWTVGGKGTLAGGTKVLQLIPTASGKAFLLGQQTGDAERTVHLATPTAEGGLAISRFLTGLSANTSVTWDGEWLYTLDGVTLNAYRDTNEDGIADDRSRIGKIFFPPDTPATPALHFIQLRTGPDGWFYALVNSAGEIAGFNSRDEPVHLPRHGLVRFRRNGEDLRLHAASDEAIAEFQFGEKGGISVFAPSAKDAGTGSRPEIRLLPPLPGSTLRDLPALPWPPAPSRDNRWSEVNFVRDRDRLYVRSGMSDFPLIAEITGLTRVADDGVRLWFTSQAEGEGEETIAFLTRPGQDQTPGVDWDKIATKDLFLRLSSPAFSVRTEAVFEILRRKYRPLGDLARLLKSEPTGPFLEGTMASLSASNDKRALRLLLEAAAGPVAVRQKLAFRHLGDDPGMKNHPVFAEISRSTNPEVTAEILSAMERTNTDIPGLEELVLSFADHPDPTLAATARVFLQTRGSTAVCFEIIDDETKKKTWPSAFAVLSRIRRLAVIEGIVLRLENTRAVALRSLGIKALLDLYYEDPVDRREWEGTPVADRYLRTSLHDHRVDRVELLRGMTAAGVPPPSPDTLVELAIESIPLEAFAVEALLSGDSNLPDKARPWLKELAQSSDRDLALRTRAIELLATHGTGEKVSEEILAAAFGREDPIVREHAREMILERSRSSVPASALASEPLTVGGMDTEMILSLLPSSDGDPLVGRQLFRKLACDACHNIHGEGPSSGPDLATSPKLASLPELVNAVLCRDLSLAPEYEASVLELAGGRRLLGFQATPREGGREFHDRVGNPFVLASGEVKHEWPATGRAMVCDTAGLLSVGEFGSLLRYLKTLAE